WLDLVHLEPGVDVRSREVLRLQLLLGKRLAPLVPGALALEESKESLSPLLEGLGSTTCCLEREGASRHEYLPLHPLTHLLAQAPHDVGRRHSRVHHLELPSSAEEPTRPSSRVVNGEPHGRGPIRGP